MRPHFRLFGIPVRVELFFFLLAGFLGWSSRRSAFLLVAWVAIVFVSVLWHEMGHALAFRAFGYPPSIVLHGFGGATSSLSREPLTPKRDIAISLAGPAAGMLLGAGVFAISRYLVMPAAPLTAGDARLRIILSDLLFVNIGWGIFNLLPMLPLDGGRIMAAALNLATKGRGDTPSLVVSLLTGALVAAAAYLTGNSWVALLVLFLGLGNLSALRQRRRIAPQMENIRLLREGYEALDRRDFSTASARAHSVLAEPKSDEVKRSATSLQMTAYMGDGKFKEAAQFGERSFNERPDPYLAYHVARAWARSGWPNQAVNWLTTAHENGFTNADEMEGEADFQALRGTLEFERLKDRMRGKGLADPRAGEFLPDPKSSSRAPMRTGRGRTVREQGANVSVVKAILLINLAVFAAQLLDPSLTLRFGQSPQAIAHGQWYRLLTPMLLHADFIHIGFNSYALWIYGPALENEVGKLRFLAMYVIAGFTGGVASYVFGPCPSLGVGASGAIFGVIGALLVFNFNRRRTSAAGAANLQGILVIIILNLVIGFAAPRIDNFAHMGGLAGGIVLGAAFDAISRLSRTGKITPVIAAGVQTAVSAAVVWGAGALAIYRTVNFVCGS